tara:strand:+ start:475 stop:1761 length:1287 start_codon:yes stop_codon:yes gene_type:complete
MAYKRKEYSAHDKMKVLPKDLSGRSSTNQRTPQIKPGNSPGKMRMANPNTGIDDVWNANSNVSTGMGNLASNAGSNIHQNQQTSGFVNNPAMNSSAGNVGGGSTYGDFYGGRKSSSRAKGSFNSKAASEAASGNRTSLGAGTTYDPSEHASKNRGTIQDMINSTVSSVQSQQDATRAKGLKKYKSDAANTAAELQAKNDAKYNKYKASSESKYNKLNASYNKMSDAQKAAAAAAQKAGKRRRTSNPVTKVAKAAGKVVKGVTKGVSKVTKSISRGIRRLFGGRRRRRKSSKKKSTTPKTVSTTPKVAIGGTSFKQTPAQKAAAKRSTAKKSTAKKSTYKKPATKKKRRRRRRRWFSDMRLKHNIAKVGLSLSGIPIYNFSYIGDNTIYQGAMAQDLISMGYNNAVTIDNKSGYYMVDYDQIDVDMTTI